MTAFHIVGLVGVFAFLWMAATLWAGPAGTQPAASQPTSLAAPTEVVIVGTLHGWHKKNPKYSLPILRDILVGIKPSAILMEFPPTIGGKRTIEDGRIVETFASIDESAAANQAAELLGVQVIPYDRDRRNEIYQETRYFERQKKGVTRLQAWLKTLAEKDPGCPEVLSWEELYCSAMQAESALMEHAGPEVINSVLSDSIKRNKHCTDFKLWPRMLAAAGQKELAGEFAFFGQEWQERNEIMSRNIVEIAKRYPGGRLAVMCGSDHRYILRDLLAKVPEVTLKEYYEVTPEKGI